VALSFGVSRAAVVAINKLRQNYFWVAQRRSLSLCYVLAVLAAEVPSILSFRKPSYLRDDISYAALSLPLKTI
jgi:hypothetical protein